MVRPSRDMSDQDLRNQFHVYELELTSPLDRALPLNVCDKLSYFDGDHRDCGKVITCRCWHFNFLVWILQFLFFDLIEFPLFLVRDDQVLLGDAPCRVI